MIYAYSDDDGESWTKSTMGSSFGDEDLGVVDIFKISTTIYILTTEYNNGTIRIHDSAFTLKDSVVLGSYSNAFAGYVSGSYYYFICCDIISADPNTFNILKKSFDGTDIDDVETVISSTTLSGYATRSILLEINNIELLIFGKTDADIYREFGGTWTHVLDSSNHIVRIVWDDSNELRARYLSIHDGTYYISEGGYLIKFTSTQIANGWGKYSNLYEIDFESYNPGNKCSFHSSSTDR